MGSLSTSMAPAVAERAGSLRPASREIDRNTDLSDRSGSDKVTVHACACVHVCICACVLCALCVCCVSACVLVVVSNHM